MSKGKIPDRWIPYEACGDVIEGTRIICFKVPLHKNVQHRVPGITKIWDVPAVLEEIPKLGAVIDLTNTARYYNPREFVAANVSHRKILMPGREIPPESKVREFMDAVDEFLGKDCVAEHAERARGSTADSLVGVHCTHGLNRTGYMVCRYMKDRLNIPAEESIKRFDKARGYQIERENYKAGILNKKPPPPDLEAQSQTSSKTESKTTDEDHGQRRDSNIRKSFNIRECGTRDNNESGIRKRHSKNSNNKRPRPNCDRPGKYEHYSRANDESQRDDQGESHTTHNGEKNRNKRQRKNRSRSKPKKRKIYHS